ncbi:MAG: hypothetical protein EA353_04255 [Puniceicoccaceae bacterium]|nr:MAG: hypothetical protein EA353_04255 [Puniceicoccaceae bacterium]
MIKKLFIGLILLCVIALVAVYLFGSSLLNRGIKSGVETFGPRVTQTPVTLGEANLSIFSGSGSLTDLLVGNPEGFKSQNIFALGQIDLKVDTSTVFSDRIVIDHILIQRPEISYEQSMRGSNVNQLMENIEAFTGPKTPQEKARAESAEGAQKQVVIRKLVIEGGSIYVGAMGLGQTVPLPRIEMENIGEGGERITMAEAIDMILGRVLQAIGPAIANSGDLLRQAGQSALDSATEGATRKLNEATGDATRKLNEATGDAVNKASEGIRGLFGN